jgi:hypothetical protein
MAVWFASIPHSHNVKQDNGNCLPALLRSCYALRSLPRDDNKLGINLVWDTAANSLQRFASPGLQGGITGNDTTNSTDPNDPNNDDDD